MLIGHLPISLKNCLFEPFAYFKKKKKHQSLYKLSRFCGLTGLSWAVLMLALIGGSHAVLMRWRLILQRPLWLLGVAGSWCWFLDFIFGLTSHHTAAGSQEVHQVDKPQCASHLSILCWSPHANFSLGNSCHVAKPSVSVSAAGTSYSSFAHF